MNIYISCTSADRDALQPLLLDLRRVSVVLGDEAREAPSGTVAADAINRCDAFVFAVTPASVASAACHAELDLARATGRPIVPILVVDVLPHLLPPPLAGLQVVDYRTRSVEGASALEQSLARAALAGMVPVDHPWGSALPPPNLSDPAQRGHTMAGGVAGTPRPTTPPPPPPAVPREAPRRPAKALAVAMCSLAGAALLSLGFIAVSRSGASDPGPTAAVGKQAPTPPPSRQQPTTPPATVPPTTTPPATAPRPTAPSVDVSSCGPLAAFLDSFGDFLTALEVGDVEVMQSLMFPLAQALGDLRFTVPATVLPAVETIDQAFGRILDDGDDSLFFSHAFVASVDALIAFYEQVCAPAD